MQSPGVGPSACPCGLPVATHVPAQIDIFPDEFTETRWLGLGQQCLPAQALGRKGAYAIGRDAPSAERLDECDAVAEPVVRHQVRICCYQRTEEIAEFRVDGRHVIERPDR